MPGDAFSLREPEAYNPFYFCCIVGNKTVVYISHPVEEDANVSIQQILDVCRGIHLYETDTIPIAPYILTIQYLNLEETDEKLKSDQAIYTYFEKKFFDALYLCGDHISVEMKEEIKWCLDLEIPIIIWDQWLQEPYDQFLEAIKQANTIN